MALSAGYTMAFTPATLRRFEAMVAAAPIMAGYYSAAMSFAVNRVATEAKQATTELFNSNPIGGTPSGTLARGIVGQVLSPLRGQVGVGYQVPYARRREYGFSGMTDSLGRTYTNDPAKPYLETGLQRSLPAIESAFVEASALAIRRIGA